MRAAFSLSGEGRSDGTADPWFCVIPGIFGDLPQARTGVQVGVEGRHGAVTHRQRIIYSAMIPVHSVLRLAKTGAAASCQCAG